MAKELEIKILDIDVEYIKEKLENIGAEFLSDSMQQIYTYDFIDISSMYHSIIFDLENQISDKVVIHAKKRLISIFFDLNDLIMEHDANMEQRTTISEIFGTTNIYEYIKNTNKIELNKLKNPAFINIIEKYHINPNKWIRLRKTGDRASLTVKHILERRTNEFGVREHSINNVLEYETYVDSFDTTKIILEQLGYYHKNYQEKRRISYKYRDLEIDIDLWPHIPPYVEIEGNNEENIFQVLDKLGYTKNDVKSMNADDVYTFYGLNMYSYKELRFE